jgi:hypothetical protein
MKPNLTRVAVHVFVVLATLGLWLVWAPSYFLLFFPDTTSETTLVHFAAAFAATAAVATVWGLFVRQALIARIPQPGARGHASAAAAIAFLLFVFLAVRMLWTMYREWSDALR